MTTRTRYFVITSLLVLAVGLGRACVAYYVGLPGGLVGRDGPDELQYVPRNAAVVAYVDVREIMLSDVRQKIRRDRPSRITRRNGRAAAVPGPDRHRHRVRYRPRCGLTSTRSGRQDGGPGRGARPVQRRED